MCIATTQTVDMISLVCIVLLAPLVACQVGLENISVYNKIEKWYTFTYSKYY